jgi:hypothetical protein
MSSTMELDDLKAAWQDLDRRLEAQQHLTRLAFRDSRFERMRRSMLPLAAGQLLQIVAGLALCLLFAPYWIAHWGTAHLVACGMLLHAYGVMLVAFAAGDLLRIARIDYAAPVLEIQQRLGELAAWRGRCVVWFVVAGCFIWVPLALIAFNALGADLWLHRPQMVGWFVGSSCVALGASWALARFARRPGQERLAQALADSAVGRSLAKARTVLAEVAEFAGD